MTLGAVWFISYVVLIVIANWAIATFGVIAIPFGLVAPAGVYAAGLTFAARNFTQQSLGRRFGYLAIVVGAALSAQLSPPVQLGGWLPLPLASGVTFLLSETADMLLWNRLRSAGLWIGAMIGGELAAQLLDSIVFLALAFGSLELLAGQVVGKWLTVAPVALCMWLARRRYAQLTA
jgi:uncharacterized PurR-regulated membrane protein YhhQ (DUF165 family)